MKKVIIRTREDELTTDMYYFGTNCAKSFIQDLEKETYGKDWKDCAYGNDDFSGWAQINKSGTISVCVFSKHNQ
tara:strand:+ start:1816 stop:2037 length:222 start_codon:yes stop_codon:yes gene_type:complete